MASRRFKQFRYSLETAIVELYADVTFGAAGAPSITAATSQGVASIVRNSAGRYTVTLQDPYVRIMNISVNSKNSTASAAPSVLLVSDSVSTGTGGVFVMQFQNGSGVATDPASGEVKQVHLTLKNSSIL